MTSAASSRDGDREGDDTDLRRHVVEVAARNSWIMRTATAIRPP
jgi:hypothetical protein